MLRHPELAVIVGLDHRRPDYGDDLPRNNDMYAVGRAVGGQGGPPRLRIGQDRKTPVTRGARTLIQPEGRALHAGGMDETFDSTDGRIAALPAATLDADLLPEVLGDVTDRSMSVMQYGLAAIAVIGAILLSRAS